MEANEININYLIKAMKEVVARCGFQLNGTGLTWDELMIQEVENLRAKRTTENGDTDAQFWMLKYQRAIASLGEMTIERDAYRSLANTYHADYLRISGELQNLQVDHEALKQIVSAQVEADSLFDNPLSRKEVKNAEEEL